MNSEREESARELLAVMRRLNHVLKTHLFKSLGSYLKPSPLNVMLVLLRNAKQGLEFMKISDIAAFAGMTLPAITPVITSLEKEGYIKRSSDPEDRRVTLIRLSEEGKRLMEPALLQMTNCFGGLIEYIGEQNGKQLTRLLQQVEEYFTNNMHDEGGCQE